MNRIVILITTLNFLLVSACNSEKQKDLREEMNSYNWMVGKWNLTSNPRMWEIWTADSNGLHGTSFKIIGKDSIQLEQMHVVPRDTAIYFIADLPENPENIEFLLVSKEVNRLKFINPQHDFPKQISYQKVGHNTLRAEVKGDKKNLKFLFVKR